MPPLRKKMKIFLMVNNEWIKISILAKKNNNYLKISQIHKKNWVSKYWSPQLCNIKTNLVRMKVKQKKSITVSIITQSYKIVKNIFHHAEAISTSSHSSTHLHTETFLRGAANQIWEKLNLTKIKVMLGISLILNYLP